MHDIDLWSVGGKRLGKMKPLQGHRTSLQALAFSADGGQLASLASEEEHGAHVIMWDMVTGKSLWEYRSPFTAEHLAFAPDGRHLAVGNNNGTAHILRLPPPLGKHGE
jgi:WD40 repeat protein